MANFLLLQTLPSMEARQTVIESFKNTPTDVAHLNKWLFENIQSYIQKRVLEMDSDSGLVASLFIEHAIPIHLNATDEHIRSSLRTRYKEEPLVRGVHLINFGSSEIEEQYSDFKGNFSTLISLNTFDHCRLEQSMLDKARLLLNLSGHLVIILPSFTAFYPESEEDLKSLKRVDQKALKDILKGFEVLKTRHFYFERPSISSIYEKGGLFVLTVCRKMEK